MNDAFSRAAASKAQDAAGVEASEQQLQEELAALRIAKEELETNFNLKQTEVDELAAAHAEFEKNLQNAHAQATVAMDKLEDAHRQQLDVLHTEKTELENRLDGADGEHRKQVMELENQTESLRKQLAESLTALETSQGESQGKHLVTTFAHPLVCTNKILSSSATLVNLEDVEARLQRANDNVASYSKRIEELETECSAHTTQYQNALVEADASKAELSAQHEQTVNQLSATIESLRAEHDTAVQELRKELDAASQHASEIAKNSETLAEKEEALHHMRESLDVLADRFNALEKEYDDVLADRDSILSRAAQSEDVHREELGKIHSRYVTFIRSIRGRAYI